MFVYVFSMTDIGVMFLERLAVRAKLLVTEVWLMRITGPS